MTAQKMKFFIKDFFSKCDQIRSILRIWSNLLKKSLLENFIFCAVYDLCSFHLYIEGIDVDLNLLNFLFDRYDLNQRMTSLENSQNFILLIRISWLIVSNAFWRSMSIIPVWRPNSKAVVILSFRIERHESAEKYFLNLDWNL